MSNFITYNHLDIADRQFIVAIDTAQDPVTFAEVVKEQKWCDAMNLELQALKDNDTWTITELPPGRRAIGCQWLFKTKYKADGSVERYKARLVVLENRWTYGIDYQDTFAPVAKMTTVRTILAVAAVKNWKMCQVDVINAFLHEICIKKCI